MIPELQPSRHGAAALPLHLVEELNHRVMNEYAEAIAGLSLAAAGDTRGEVRTALRAAADRLRAHADSHRALLPPLAEEVNLADYIGRLCATYSRAALAGRRVQLMFSTEDVWVPSDRGWRLALAVAELVRNAARHGLKGRDGVIAVSLGRCGGEVCCVVGDNGLAPGQPVEGRGFALVRALAAELGGAVEWRFGDGGSFARLRAPAEALA